MSPSEGFTPLWRERIRFLGVEIVPESDDGPRAVVELLLAGGARIRGDAEFLDDLSGEEASLHATARATLDALQPVLAGRLDLSLEGVRSLEAFDDLLVVVSVSARSREATYSLIGAVSAPDGDAVRGAALAVLDSANRIVEHFAHGAATLD